jgi:hypothetical protein
MGPGCLHRVGVLPLQKANARLGLPAERKKAYQPADVLLGKLKKDVSFALRRGTIAQVTTTLDAGQRAAEDELALNMAGWDR